MAKKKAKPKHAPLKPTTAWAVVNRTGNIVKWLGRFDIYLVRRDGLPNAYGGNRVQKVRITEA